MGQFRDKSLQLLIATDVAARGIDVVGITHVINYELPDDLEVYTHRSGRTGRAGSTGISSSIVHSREIGKLKQIERMAAKAPVHGQAAPAVATKAPSAVEEDVAQLSMSTLSFQDYVRERMLRRRKAAMAPKAAAALSQNKGQTDFADSVMPDRSSVLEQRMSAPAAAPMLRESAPVRDPVREPMREPMHASHDMRVPALADVHHDVHESYSPNSTHGSQSSYMQSSHLQHEAHAAQAVHSAAATGPQSGRPP